MVSCLTFFICPFFDPISIETSHAPSYGWEKIKAQLNPWKPALKSHLDHQNHMDVSVFISDHQDPVWPCCMARTSRESPATSDPNPTQSATRWIPIPPDWKPPVWSPKWWGLWNRISQGFWDFSGWATTPTSGLRACAVRVREIYSNPLSNWDELPSRGRLNLWGNELHPYEVHSVPSDASN